MRVKGLDFQRRELTVRDGKSGKDRQLKVRHLHQNDLASGWGRVLMPYAPARKYPTANCEWGWQGAAPCAGPCWRAASINPPRRIPFVTPSLPICWSVDRTSARSRS